MPKLALTDTFWQSWDRLEKPIRSGVRKAMAKFQQLSVAELHSDAGLHLESVHNARDARMRTIRITDFYRGVVLAPDDGSDVFLLLNVVPHNDAYGWAANRLYTINSATGALEVRNVIAIEQLTPPLEQAAAKAPTALFAEYSDTVLRDLGIDDQVLRAARAVTDKGQLDAFSQLMPEDQYEVLQYLAEGFSAEEVYRDLVAERQPAGADDSLATAIANTTNRITLVHGPDELAEILTKPFAAWRVFLHPSQRRVAYRVSYNGPAQVTGGPGTGKTVVALHRVKHLLTRHPGSRVLLTTYTTALARNLRENLALLLDDDDLLSRVDVTTVNAYAHRVVREVSGRPPAPINDADELKIWRRIRSDLDLPSTEQFLAHEHRHVIVVQQIATRDDYLQADRRGRGRPLAARQRERLWTAVQRFRAELDATQTTTQLLMCARAAELLGSGDLSAHGYDHVVVDEAQDLHPAQWRVLRAAVPERADDLFITGDPHQRIYDSRVSLRALGVSVAGRSSRLRVNYRSTEEILAWSVAILNGTPVEGLDGNGNDNLGGYRSLLHGKRPVTEGHPSERAEIHAVVERVRQWIDEGVLADEIAVCARFNALLIKVRDALVAAGIAAVRVKDQPSAVDAGVRLATMHSMKGLEFRCVAAIGVTATIMPLAKDVIPANVDARLHEADLMQQRCLLFVACTRARESLSVTWYGAPSPFLPRSTTLVRTSS